MTIYRIDLSRGLVFVLNSREAVIDARPGVFLYFRRGIVCRPSQYRLRMSITADIQ